MGLVLSNPVLAQGLTRFFDVEVPMLAYEVRLAADGKSLEWIERTASGEKRYDTEPETTGPRAWASICCRSSPSNGCCSHGRLTLGG